MDGPANGRGRGCGLPVPVRTGCRRPAPPFLHVIVAARLAQQIPGNAAVAARARPAGLVHAVAGVTAAAAVVAATRVSCQHVIGHGHDEYFATQLARHGLLLLVGGHQPSEYPLVVLVSGRIRRDRGTAAAAATNTADDDVTAVVVVRIVGVVVVTATRAAASLVVQPLAGSRRPIRRRVSISAYRRYYLHT